MPPNQQYVSRTQKPTSHTQPPQTSQHQSMNALPAGLFKQSVPLQHEQVIQLQQQLGNQATMRLLQRQHQSPDVTKKTIQRYTKEEHYSFNSEIDNTQFFESQGVSFNNGKYYRVKKFVEGDKITSVKEEYDTGTSAWVEVSRQELESKPPMRVSENGHFAMEATSQARTFFIDASLISGINAKLTKQKSKYVLQKSGASVTFPKGVAGRGSNFTLTQVSAVRLDKLVDKVDKLEDMSLSTTRLVGVCHDIAKNISSKLPTTTTEKSEDEERGTNEEARPETGQKYFFDNQTDKSHTSNQMPLTSPNRSLKQWYNKAPKKKSLDTVINELAEMDEKLAKIDENYSQVEALEVIPGGMTDEAKAMLPGWGDHSESVITNDGNDDVTLVNYNRSAEYSWVMAHQFRNVYRSHKNFRSEFKKLYKKATKNTTASVGELVGLVLLGKFDQVVELAAKYDEEAAQAMQSVKETLKQVGAPEMGYFDMYGAEEQSFHHQFKILGGRGSDDVKTTVVGTPTEAPEEDTTTTEETDTTTNKVEDPVLI